MKAAPPLIRAAVLLRPSGGAARRPTSTQVKVKVKVKVQTPDRGGTLARKKGGTVPEDLVWIEPSRRSSFACLGRIQPTNV